jgi:hypothetical protein
MFAWLIGGVSRGKDEKIGIGVTRIECSTK